MKELILQLIEESDRGCVLVAAAKLEGSLEEIFAKIFAANSIPKKVSLRIFDIGGPLSTFSAKNKMAYAMGLISSEVYSDIEIIRGLRNKFAHSIDSADFVDPNVEKIVYSLNCVKPLNIKPPAPREKIPLSAQQQAKIFADGYVKLTKTAFAFGVGGLLQSLSFPAV